MALTEIAAPAEMQAAFETFKQAYPGFEKTGKLDELRAVEYGRLDRAGQVYLDYTGGGLYAETQLREHLGSCWPARSLATPTPAI